MEENLIIRKWENTATLGGIEFRTTIEYTSAQNALAERRTGIILNDARTLLIDSVLIHSGLPAEYWGYATAHAVYLRNRIPRAVSPHEALLDRKPRTDHFRIFGCAAYTWIPPAHRELGKLDARAELTTFLGLEGGTSNCLLVDRDSGRFFRAGDVRFVESNTPGLNDLAPDLKFLDIQCEKEQEEQHKTSGSTREEEAGAKTTITTNTLPPAPARPPAHPQPQMPLRNNAPIPSPVANRTRHAIRLRTPPPAVIHDEPPQVD